MKNETDVQIKYSSSLRYCYYYLRVNIARRSRFASHAAVSLAGCATVLLAGCATVLLAGCATILLAGCATILLAGCATTTAPGAVGVERRQIMLAPAEQVNQMAAQGYLELKQESAQKQQLDQNSAQVDRINKIVQRLTPKTSVFREDAPGWAWETHVVTSDEVNAFCMPGGKIAVYTGLLNKVQPTDAELAAVLGHEIAHALREHGRERLSQQMIQEGGLKALVGISRLDPRYAQAASQVANVLITLPYSRVQESEADELGVELMARAGYDPQEAVSLWKKMAAVGGKSHQPEFLSTHPSDAHRIARIQGLLPKVEPLYKR